jgi:hypothetical protein
MFSFEGGQARSTFETES